MRGPWLECTATVVGLWHARGRIDSFTDETIMSHPTGTSTPCVARARPTQRRWKQGLRVLCVLALLCGAGAAVRMPLANAAEVEGRDATTTTLYKGRVGERAVTLYLKSEPA